MMFDHSSGEEGERVVPYHCFGVADDVFDAYAV